MRPLSSLKGKVLFLLFLMGISTSVSAQYDMQWIFGYGQDQDLKFGFTLMDFNEGELEVDYYGPALNQILFRVLQVVWFVIRQGIGL